jgi:hypothetical protein
MCACIAGDRRRRRCGMEMLRSHFRPRLRLDHCCRQGAQCVQHHTRIDLLMYVKPSFSFSQLSRGHIMYVGVVDVCTVPAGQCMGMIFVKSVLRVLRRVL